MDEPKGKSSLPHSYAQSVDVGNGGPATMWQSKGPQRLEEDEVRPRCCTHSIFSRHPQGGRIPHGQAAELLI